MDISLHLSSSKTPSPGAPNPDFSVESASAGHPLIGSSEALGCYLGRCGEVRVDPERLRRDFCTKTATRTVTTIESYMLNLTSYDAVTGKVSGTWMLQASYAGREGKTRISGRLSGSGTVLW